MMVLGPLPQMGAGRGLKYKMYLTESSLCNVPWNGLAAV
jgi:hypothetical protein